MKQETTFTEAEVNFVKNVFAAQRINPMDTAAVETIERVQSIVQKMESLKASQEVETNGKQPE